MALQQQPPPASYVPQQQQRGRCRSLCCTFQDSSGRYKAPAYPQPATAGQCPMQPPNPFKRFENWNYCHTHGGDVNNNHTSGTCQKLGPLHNPSATQSNIMGGTTAGLHKAILSSISGHAPPPLRQQRAPTPSNVAAATTSHHLHSNNGSNASNNANDANDALPGHQPHGPAVWILHPCCCAACSGSHTSCGHDDALLCTVPAASPLLTVRGEQQYK